PTAERDRLRRRAEDLAGRGEAAAAVKAAEEALALDRAAFGANSAATADGLEVLARVRERNERWAQAAAARREAARILAGLYGPADWRATDARFAAADTDRRAARSAAARRDEEAATALNREVLAALDRGEPAAALGPARRALLIRLRVLGPDHPNTLVSLNNLSRVYEDAGDRDEAEAVCRRALRGRERVLGPNHPHVAVSLHNLALLVAARGASDEAVRLL